MFDDTAAEIVEYLVTDSYLEPDGPFLHIGAEAERRSVGVTSRTPLRWVGGHAVALGLADGVFEECVLNLTYSQLTVRNLRRCMR